MQRREGFDRVQHEAEQEQDCGASDDVAAHAAGDAAPPRERERNRGAHREQQERKDQIGRRPAVPRRVVERRVDRVPCARRADENHRRDREATKRVERVEA